MEYVRSPGLRGRPNNNLIERFHGTIKDRTKPMRGFKADYSCGPYSTASWPIMTSSEDISRWTAGRPRKPRD